MTTPRGTNARTIAELLVQLGRIAHGSGYTGGLTPAQWTALRYLSRANRFSRTVSAFAEFHSTTRGTASQTVKGLVALGYLVRERSARDGRSSRLDVTDAAWALLERDPCEELARAAGGLSSTTRSHLAMGLERILDYLAHDSGKRTFGVCTLCAHMNRERCTREGTVGFECAFFGELLEPSELEQLCVNFKPRSRRSRAREASR